MSPIKYLLLIILFSNIFVAKIYSQSNSLTKNQIINLIKESDAALLNLEFEKSLIYAKKALEQSFLINDNESIANCYNEIAGNYEQLSEYDRALEYYDFALKYAKKANNKITEEYVYNNRANIYFFYQKKYQLGIESYQKAIKCSELTNDKKQLAFTYTNLCWAYFTINENVKALECLEYINKNKSFIPDFSSVANIEMLNAMAFGVKGDITNAKKYFENAIAIAKKNNLEYDLLSIYEEYSDYLLKIKDYENAASFHKKFDEIKDKTFNDKLLINAQLISKKIDLDIYKNQFVESQNENKVQKIIIHKTKIINTLFAVTLVFLLLFLITLFRNSKIRNKTNNLLIQKNKELEIANLKAVESSNLKSQFVSTISHELRTPLYGVIGITNMLIDEHRELAESKHLKSLEFSANYLLSLVNDILHINKIEENKAILDKQVFDVSEEINLIKNSLIFLSDANNNIFEVKIDSKIPKLLIGDKLKLNQILINLISNALKFTKNGIIKININLVQNRLTKCILEFEISDNGEGIAKDDQEKIFEQFVQVGKDNQDYQGTGLGLSIVKKLIDLFDSELILKSEIGKGTSFTFSIAFEIKNDFNNAIEDNKVIIPNKSLKILVVEDNKINQIVTKKIIEKYNSDCYLIDNGYKAIELLKKEKFDIILMDINMPDIDGYETTRLIRLSGNQTPIIALTAYSKNEVSKKVFDSGMNDILIKPFEAYKLFEIINKCLT